eukprot:4454510-Pyramimonas_sp.AAC.1
MYSEQRRAIKMLYEAAGGNLVGGSLPALSTQSFAGKLPSVSTAPPRKVSSGSTHAELRACAALVPGKLLGAHGVVDSMPEVGVAGARPPPPLHSPRKRLGL